MMILLLTLFSLGAAQPSGSGEKCELKGELAILLDPAVDSETFSVLKLAAVNAALSFNLSETRVGIWQMTQPPTMEQAMGPTNRDELVQQFMEIVQNTSSTVQNTSSTSEGAADALKEAANSFSDNQTQSDKNKAILYVAGSPKNQSLLRAAEEVRQQSILIRAIAVGMNDRDVEDLFAVTGGDAGVLRLAKDAEGVAWKVEEFVCTNDHGFAQDFCFPLCW